jgi:hypothetical protein
MGQARRRQEVQRLRRKLESPDPVDVRSELEDIFRDGLGASVEQSKAAVSLVDASANRWVEEDPDNRTRDDFYNQVFASQAEGLQALRTSVSFQDLNALGSSLETIDKLLESQEFVSSLGESPTKSSVRKALNRSGVSDDLMLWMGLESVLEGSPGDPISLRTVRDNFEKASVEINRQLIGRQVGDNVEFDREFDRLVEEAKEARDKRRSLEGSDDVEAFQEAKVLEDRARGKLSDLQKQKVEFRDDGTRDSRDILIRIPISQGDGEWKLVRDFGEFDETVLRPSSSVSQRQPQIGSRPQTQLLEDTGEREPDTVIPLRPGAPADFKRIFGTEPPTLSFQATLKAFRNATQNRSGFTESQVRDLDPVSRQQVRGRQRNAKQRIINRATRSFFGQEVKDALEETIEKATDRGSTVRPSILGVMERTLRKVSKLRKNQGLKAAIDFLRNSEPLPDREMELILSRLTKRLEDARE